MSARMRVEDILDLAIQKEQESADFYLAMADRSENPAMAQVFKQYAAEELSHKKRLMDILAGTARPLYTGPLPEAMIEERDRDIHPDEFPDYRKALELAMKREKAAFRLYMDLANATSDKELKHAFWSLAQEEAKHKLRFEIEHDDIS